MSFSFLLHFLLRHILYSSYYRSETNSAKSDTQPGNNQTINNATSTEKYRPLSLSPPPFDRILKKAAESKRDASPSLGSDMLPIDSDSDIDDTIRLDDHRAVENFAQSLARKLAKESSAQASRTLTSLHLDRDFTRRPDGDYVTATNSNGVCLYFSKRHRKQSLDITGPFDGFGMGVSNILEIIRDARYVCICLSQSRESRSTMDVDPVVAQVSQKSKVLWV